MHRRVLASTIVALVLLSLPSAAAAGSDPSSLWSVSTGVGFTAGPDAFLLGFETDYRLDYALSVGGAMQLGMDDEITLVSPSAYARYKFSNPFSGQLRKLRPYLQGGIGLNYVNRDVPASSALDDDDIGFLMNFGFGTEYVLSDALSIGSRMLFNVTPTDVFDDTFYFSWEVTTLRYRF